jgi:hypothetical protein
MLSLTKKSDQQGEAEPLWHPNFRNFERLPDTKVVRTTFFVNTAAIAITIGLLLWFGYREYHIYDLGVQIADAQKQIDNNARQNREAIRLSKVFSDEEVKLAELVAFRHSAISPAELILILGQTLPREVSIESIDARLGDANAATLVLRGLVAGTPDQASGAASSYVDGLRAHAQLSKIFGSITLTNLNRDSRSGFLAFEIMFKAKSAAK